MAVASALLTALANSQTPPAAYLCTPEQRQLEWHRLEYYAFVHFGHNTFTNEEWGHSQSTPDVFNPTSLDTDQWAREFAGAGLKGMILTAKHHDGMALWNTTTTTYKIGNSAWAANREVRGLETDVVKMAAISAKKFGLKFGVYLSPWDMHRDPAMPKPHLAGTVYDEPQIFGDANPGDYNEFYSKQLTELVTMKLNDDTPVELFEIWLDGASGSTTKQTFAWTKFRDIIRQHQPGAIMWGHQGVDARWVGNEDGFSPVTNWHTINSTQDDPRLSENALMLGARNGLYWTPAESDARIRNGWFWHADERPKTSEALMKMYMETVGRSVALLLDVPPDTRGLIGAEDIDSLLKFKTLRESSLNQELLRPGIHVTASSVRGNNNATYGPSMLLDGNTNTYWAMDDDRRTGSVDIDLGRTCSVTGFIVQEHIALGQRIGGYAFDIMTGGKFNTVVTGTSLGYKRIDKPSTVLRTSRVRFRITQSNAVPLIQSLQVLGAGC